MVKSQKNEERFREEQKYLDAPLAMPTEKNEKGEEKRVADVFLRPPKGIDSKPQPEPRNDLLWQYRARSTGYDFSGVELAFADEDKNFADKVLISYVATEQSTRDTFQFTPPGQEQPLIFDTWKFSNGQEGYSIN